MIKLFSSFDFNLLEGKIRIKYFIYIYLYVYLLVWGAIYEFVQIEKSSWEVPKLNFLRIQVFLIDSHFMARLGRFLSEIQSDTIWCPRHFAFRRPEITLKNSNHWKKTCHFEGCWFQFLLGHFPHFFRNHKKFFCRNFMIPSSLRKSLLKQFLWIGHAYFSYQTVIFHRRSLL